MGLLGHALSLKAERGFEELLRGRLLDPLGLKDTRITLSEEQRARRAAGHWGVVPWSEFTMPALEGAGALLSTAEDMLTFLEHVSGLNTNVLGAIATEATRRRAAGAAPNIDMALGWLLVNAPGGQLVQHDGATYGQNAFLGFHRASRRGVVVLCNNRLSTYGSMQDAGFHLLDPVLPLTEPRRPTAVPAETLASYEGRYSMNGFSFDVQLRHGRLTLDFAPDASPGFTVHAQSTTRFAVYEFGINGSGTFKVTGTDATLSWTQGGATLALPRIATLPRLQIRRTAGETSLTLAGTPGFQYNLESSSDLRRWNHEFQRSADSGEFMLTETAEQAGFYRSKLPALE